jgi:hypothetical protein
MSSNDELRFPLLICHRMAMDGYRPHHFQLRNSHPGNHLSVTVEHETDPTIDKLFGTQPAKLAQPAIVFPPHETKGRKVRKARLPEKVLAELKAVAGPV